jgi:hypothetical protein
MKTNLSAGLRSALRISLFFACSFTWSDYASAQCVSGASAIIWGPRCGEPDWINTSSAGQLTGGVINNWYYYTYTVQSPTPMQFYNMTFGTVTVTPGTLFQYTSNPMNIEMEVLFPCNFPCGVSRTITINFYSQIGTFLCQNVYTFKSPITTLSASPSANNCTNVPVTVSISSQSSPSPLCVYTVQNTNTLDWRVNGSNASTIQVYSSSVTVTNVSGTNSSTTIRFWDASCCYVCEHICNIPQITLTSVSPSPIANAGPDKYHCCYVTLGTPAQANTTYSWSPTTGLNNPNIAQPNTWMTGITYTVTATSTISGCTAQDQVYVGAGSGNCCRYGIDDSPEDILVSIFPNPSSTSFSADLSVFEGNGLTIRVIDVMGKIAATYENVAPGNNFEFGSELSTGVYRVMVDADRTYTTKIVKQ